MNNNTSNNAKYRVGPSTPVQNQTTSMDGVASSEQPISTVTSVTSVASTETAVPAAPAASQSAPIAIPEAMQTVNHQDEQVNSTVPTQNDNLVNNNVTPQNNDVKQEETNIIEDSGSNALNGMKYKALSVLCFVLADAFGLWALLYLLFFGAKASKVTYMVVLCTLAFISVALFITSIVYSLKSNDFKKPKKDKSIWSIRF